MDHNTWLTLIAGVLVALSGAIIAIWGDPGKRMAHEEALGTIEARAEESRARIEAKAAESRAKIEAKHHESLERLVASWERRAETLETRQAALDAANQSLRDRIDELERQVSKAGNVHVADLATIANLREELDAHVAELEGTREALAARDLRIADLESRVAELEDALRDNPPGAKAKYASKMAAVSKKKGKAGK